MHFQANFEELCYAVNLHQKVSSLPNSQTFPALDDTSCANCRTSCSPDIQLYAIKSTLVARNLPSLWHIVQVLLTGSVLAKNSFLVHKTFAFSANDLLCLTSFAADRGGSSLGMDDHIQNALTAGEKSSHVQEDVGFGFHRFVGHRTGGRNGGR